MCKITVSLLYLLLRLFICSVNVYHCSRYLLLSRYYLGSLIDPFLSALESFPLVPVLGIFLRLRPTLHSHSSSGVTFSDPFFVRFVFLVVHVSGVPSTSYVSVYSGSPQFSSLQSPHSSPVLFPIKKSPPLFSKRRTGGGGVRRHSPMVRCFDVSRPLHPTFT